MQLHKNGSNATKWTKMDRRGPHMTKVDRIQPKQTEWTEVDQI